MEINSEDEIDSNENSKCDESEREDDDNLESLDEFDKYLKKMRENVQNDKNVNEKKVLLENEFNLFLLGGELGSNLKKVKEQLSLLKPTSVDQKECFRLQVYIVQKLEAD